MFSLISLKTPKNMLLPENAGLQAPEQKPSPQAQNVFLKLFTSAHLDFPFLPSLQLFSPLATPLIHSTSSNSSWNGCSGRRRLWNSPDANHIGSFFFLLHLYTATAEWGQKSFFPWESQKHGASEFRSPGNRNP